MDGARWAWKEVGLQRWPSLPRLRLASVPHVPRAPDVASAGRPARLEAAVKIRDTRADFFLAVAPSMPVSALHSSDRPDGWPYMLLETHANIGTRRRQKLHRLIASAEGVFPAVPDMFVAELVRILDEHRHMAKLIMRPFSVHPTHRFRFIRSGLISLQSLGIARIH